MGETLSQDEVDALLKGMAEGEVSLADDAPPGEARGYDLVGEERSVGRQFPGLEMIHQRLLRKLRQSFTQLVGVTPTLEIAGVEMLRFATFRNRLERGAALSLFSMSPLRGQGLMVLGPALTFQLVDRIFGGSGDAPARQEPREHSAIEIQVVQRVVRRILGDLGEAWETVVPLECKFVRVESNPALVAIAGSEDMILALELKCDLGTGPTRITIAIPFGTLEPVRAKLGEPQVGRDVADREWQMLMARAVQDAEVTVSVELGVAEVDARQVLGMAVGELLPLATRGDDPVLVRVEGQAFVRAMAGVSRGQNAVRVLDDQIGSF